MACVKEYRNLHLLVTAATRLSVVPIQALFERYALEH